MATTIVRIRPAPRPKLEQRRGLIERAAALHPGFGRHFVRAIMRLPHGPLRRALVRRMAVAYAAVFNRRDLDLIPRFLAPDGVIRPARSEGIPIGLDIKPLYRGPAGLREFVDDWTAAWGENFRLEVREVFDLGTRLVLLHEMQGYARGSGAELRQPEAELLILGDDGFVQRVEQFWSWDEALGAAGVAPLR